MVDFVIPRGAKERTLLEVKASRTVTPALAQLLNRLASSIKGFKLQLRVVHGGAGPSVGGRTISPDVAKVPLPELLAEL